VQELNTQQEITVRSESGIYYGWVIVAVCFGVIALISPVLGSFSVFYAAVLGDFSWSRGSTAIAMSIHLVVSGLTAPVAGGLVDRYGPRRVMPIGALITAAALVWLSRSTELWHFYLGFGVVAAIGSAMLNTVPLMTVVSHWFERRRGTAMGIVTMGQGAGQLALMLIQMLIGGIGWRNTYLVLAAAIAVVPTTLIYLFLYLRPSDRGVAGDAQRANEEENSNKRSEVVIVDRQWAETEWTVRRAVGTFRFWALMLMMACFAAGFFLVSTHLIVFLTDKGYSAVLAASVLGVQGVINIAGRFSGGVLADRLGREWTITLSSGLFIVCVVLLNAAGWAASPLLVYSFAVFYAMGSGMTLPALSASAADLFQGKHFGSIFGVIMLGGLCGGALGAWLGGRLVDLTNAYSVNFLVAATVMIASAVLIWKARPSRVRVIRRI
jgi:MFS family permease